MLFYWIYHSSTLAAAIRIAFRFGFMRRLSSELSKKFPFHRPAFAIFAIAIYKQINDDRTKNVQKWICWLQKSSSSNWKEWNVPCSYFRISHLFSSNSIFLFSFAISFIAFWRTHKKKMFSNISVAYSVFDGINFSWSKIYCCRCYHLAAINVLVRGECERINHIHSQIKSIL